MNPLPPDRRDNLLHDLYNDDAGSTLASRMAARVRLRRRIRRATAACAVLAIFCLGLFQSRPRSTQTPLSVATTEPTPSSPVHPPAQAYMSATDDELLAALKDESVMVFTLADGQRQVVWLKGQPKI